jgi:hypothetical protein
VRTFLVYEYLTSGGAMQEKEKNIARIYIRRAIHQVETVQRSLPGWIEQDVNQDIAFVRDIKKILNDLHKLENNLR